MVPKFIKLDCNECARFEACDENGEFQRLAHALLAASGKVVCFLGDDQRQILISGGHLKLLPLEYEGWYLGMLLQPALFDDPEFVVSKFSSTGSLRQHLGPLLMPRCHDLRCHGVSAQSKGDQCRLYKRPIFIGELILTPEQLVQLPPLPFMRSREITSSKVVTSHSSRQARGSDARAKASPILDYDSPEQVLHKGFPGERQLPLQSLPDGNHLEPSHLSFHDEFVQDEDDPEDSSPLSSPASCEYSYPGKHTLVSTKVDPDPQMITRSSKIKAGQENTTADHGHFTLKAARKAPSKASSTLIKTSLVKSKSDLGASKTPEPLLKSSRSAGWVISH